MNVAQDKPLAEITLRKYEAPYSLSERELIKKLCLSLGLLQPGDSRDIIVDVFYVLIKNGELSSEEVRVKAIEFRKLNGLDDKGAAGSNIRRQLKRLKDIFFVESIGNKYRIAEKESLLKIFEDKIEQFYLKGILERIKEYLKVVGK